MSILENILEAVQAGTAATLRNNELLEQAAAGREAVMGAVEKATAKPADKKAAAKPAAETPAAKPAAADGAVDAVAAAVGKYMEGTEGAERDARKAKVAELFGKVGAAKRSEIPADKEAAVLKALATLTEQGNLIVDEPAGDDDDLLN